MPIWRVSLVGSETGLSSASVYKQVRLGLFPPPIKITARASGWDSELVQDWIRAKLAGEQWRPKPIYASVTNHYPAPTPSTEGGGQCDL